MLCCAAMLCCVAHLQVIAQVLQCRCYWRLLALPGSCTDACYDGCATHNDCRILYEAAVCAGTQQEPGRLSAEESGSTACCWQCCTGWGQVHSKIGRHCCSCCPAVVTQPDLSAVNQPFTTVANSSSNSSKRKLPIKLRVCQTLWHCTVAPASRAVTCRYPTWMLFVCCQLLYIFPA